ERQRPPGTNRLEGSGGGTRDAGCASHPVTLSHRHDPIGVETRQHLTTPIGPDHFQAVHALCSTEPEVLSVVHGGHVPPVGRMVEILLLSPRRQGQLRADPPAAGGLPIAPYPPA